jgi:hypothetical protein
MWLRRRAFVSDRTALLVGSLRVRCELVYERLLRGRRVSADRSDELRFGRRGVRLVQSDRGRRMLFGPLHVRWGRVLRDGSALRLGRMRVRRQLVRRLLQRQRLSARRERGRVRQRRRRVPDVLWRVRGR